MRSPSSAAIALVVTLQIIWRRTLHAIWRKSQAERPVRKPVAKPERNAIHFRNAQTPSNRKSADSLQNRSFVQGISLPKIGTGDAIQVS